MERRNENRNKNEKQLSERRKKGVWNMLLKDLCFLKVLLGVVVGVGGDVEGGWGI